MVSSDKENDGHQDIDLGKPSRYVGADTTKTYVFPDFEVAAQSALQRFYISEQGTPVRAQPWTHLATRTHLIDKEATHARCLKCWPTCRACRMQHQPCRRTHLEGKHAKPDALPALRTWLDGSTAEHARCCTYEKSRLGVTCTVVAQDRHDTWIGLFPIPTYNAQDTAYARRHVVGPPSQPEHLCSDDPGESVAAVKDIGWPVMRGISIFDRPQTNRIA